LPAQGQSAALQEQLRFSTMRRDEEDPLKPNTDSAQVPTWSAGDLDFFLHGSMKARANGIPEDSLTALRAEAPNPKLQAPGKFQTPSSKKRGSTFPLEFGASG
jgi:hypothetical protein